MTTNIQKVTTNDAKLLQGDTELPQTPEINRQTRKEMKKKTQNERE